MDMHNTLVSVIITCYNYADYVEEAIKSIQQQTYKNIELIVIDDGSTDNSLSIIKKYKDVARIISRENKGIVYTRNEGIKVANGEFICFLDADDYFNPDYIERSVKAAKRYKADVMYPNWRVFGDREYKTEFLEFDVQLLIRHELHCTAESLIRKSAIGQHKFESERVAEDWDFFLGLALEGKKFKLIKDNYINYRVRANTRGTAREYWDDMYTFCEILQKWQAKYPEVVNPIDLPIAVGKARDKFIEEQKKLINEQKACLDERERGIHDRDNRIQSLEQAILNLQQSHAYRLGEALLKPVVAVRNKIKKK